MPVAPYARFCIVLIATLGIAPTAWADALVQVEVRSESGGTVDGEVVLRNRAGSGDAPTYRCTTTRGACSIDGVPGGRYTATFTPRGGEAQPGRTVMIPPDGTVRLRVPAP